MSHEEKNTVLQIIIGIIINIWIAIEVRGLYLNGIMDSPNAIQTWAETILWIVVVSIVAGITFHDTWHNYIFDSRKYNFWRKRHQLHN